MNKKILIAGANGLVGQKLVLDIRDNYEVLAVDLHPESKISSYSPANYLELDITSYNKVKEVIQEFKPDFIINAAAYTNVDGCEDEKELSKKINVTGPKYLAELARRHHAHLTHISSDYIFDGKNGPYVENDQANPISSYGLEKLESENEIIATGCKYTIFRGIVIYGQSVDTNLNFTSWLMRELSSKKEVRIVTDQWGNTTLAEDVSKGIVAGITKGAEGFFHIGNEHFHSRYDFSVEFAKFFNYDKNLIKPVLTMELKQKAKRPLRSGLIINKIKSELKFKPFELEEGFALLKKQAENG